MTTERSLFDAKNLNDYSSVSSDDDSDSDTSDDFSSVASCSSLSVDCDSHQGSAKRMSIYDAKDFGPFPLLGLSGEIRNMIYELVLRSADERLFRLVGSFDKARPTAITKKNRAVSPRFLQTCRQIYTEGVQVWYGKNHFSFQDTQSHAGIECFAKFNKVITRRSMAILTSISVEADCIDEFLHHCDRLDDRRDYPFLTKFLWGPTERKGFDRHFTVRTLKYGSPGPTYCHCCVIISAVSADILRDMISKSGGYPQWSLRIDVRCDVDVYEHKGHEVRPIRIPGLVKRAGFEIIDNRECCKHHYWIERAKASLAKAL